MIKTRKAAGGTQLGKRNGKPQGKNKVSSNLKTESKTIVNEVALMKTTITLQAKFDEESPVNLLDADHIECNYNNQTRVFHFDLVSNLDNQHSERLAEKIAFFASPEHPCAAICISDTDNRFIQNASMIKMIVNQVPIEHYDVYMSYYCIDCNLNTTNDLFSSPDNVDPIECLAKRQVHSAQHVVDLVQLGNLTRKQCPTETAESLLVYVLKFELIGEEKNVTHLILDMQISEKLSQDPKMIMLENYVCNRQRQKPQIDSHIIIDQLRPCLELPKARLTLINQLSQDRLKNEKEMTDLLEMFERIKQYGTDRDIHGELILVENQALLETMKSTQDEHDQLQLNISLVHNVSALETEMLDVYKRFLKSTNDSLQDHEEIYKAFVDAKLQDNMCVQLLDRLHTLFQAGASFNTEMISHVRKYKLGLEQLKLVPQTD